MSRFEICSYQSYEAKKFGCAYKAIIVETIRRSIQYKRDGYDESKYHFDDHWWMQDSLKAWQDRFPYLSLKTIQRYLAELCDSGYLIKRTKNGGGVGRLPSFYRINPEQDLALACEKAVYANQQTQNDTKPQKTRGQFDHRPEDNLTIDQRSKSPLHLLSTNNHTVNHSIYPSTPPSESDIALWHDSDPLAVIYENLCMFKPLKAKFKFGDWEEWLIALGEKDGLSIRELEAQSMEWQAYHNEPGGKKPVKFKASFKTWINNYILRKKQNGKPRQKESAKVDLSRDDGKHSRVNPERPWETLDD